MSDEPTDPRVGTVLQGRYRILKRLAVGAMGTVYRAERLKLGRVVAIKFLHDQIAQDPQFTKRFEREALAMSQLSHPHCVSVMDFGLADAPYIVMDFVAGQTLLDLLDHGRLPVPRALHVGRQILAGLAHAHGQGIIHRDIKPANIILTEATGTGDHVRILDFGLATLRSGRTGDLSQSSIIVGTPSYMSPEQSMGEKVDARSDVYSAGVLLYQLLTGEKPFEADETYELLQLIREQPAPALRDRAAEVAFSDELEGVIARSLSKDPAARFGSAIDFAVALDAVPEAQAPTPVRSRTAFAPTMQTEAMSPPPPPARRKRGGGLAAFALVLFAGGAAAAWALWAPPAERREVESAEPIAARAAAEREPDELADPASAAAGPDSADSADSGVAEADDVLEADDAGVMAVDGGIEEEFLDGELPDEELDEPVAAVAEDAEEVAAQPEPEPAPDPTIRVDTVDDAKALIAQGRRQEAIRGLLGLQRRYPKNAYIPYMLGSLYFERMWWSVGLDQYRLAIRNNRAYRKRSVLINNAIRALGSASSRGKAAALLRRDVGWAGVPYLRRAAKSDRNPRVRQRAAYLVKVITKSSGSKPRRSSSKKRRRRR